MNRNTREPVRISGAVNTADPTIRFARITAERWGTRLGRASPCEYVRVQTYLVAQVRTSEGEALGAGPISPPSVVPDTIRHCPYLKGRMSRCGKSSPHWLDLGQTIHEPASAGFNIVSPDGWVTTPREGQIIAPPVPGDPHVVWDVWIFAAEEPLDCCPGEQRWTLTDSITVPTTGDDPTRVVVPPHARCLTIHKGTGQALDLAWASDPLVVGTAGMPAAASALSLAVPDAAFLELTNAGAAETVILVWECAKA